jgi:type VI secretion system protein ImpA
MDEKFQSQTPGLRSLKNTLEDIRLLVARICKEKQPTPLNNTSNSPIITSPNLEIEEKGEKSTSYAQVSTNFPTTSGIIKSRSDALHRLKEIAEFFHKTEPHSPVSFLIERAVKWGEMPLNEWLAEVIKNNDALEQVKETLGIKS